MTFYGSLGEIWISPQPEQNPLPENKPLVIEDVCFTVIRKLDPSTVKQEEK